LAGGGEGLGVLLGFESPLSPGRSVVVLSGSTPAAVEAMFQALRDPEQVPRIQGDLVLLAGGRAQGYALGRQYTHGTMPPWLWPQYYLGDNPLGLVALLALVPLLVAPPLYWALRRRAVRRLRERSA
jgi:hypothetical protein